MGLGGRKWPTMPQGIGAISAQLIDLRHFLSVSVEKEERLAISA